MAYLTLAVIPARGGSKGVPGKNIRPLAGKPLIAHTIEAARKATLLSHCVVSTDSEEIARVAREFGASVPFMRPAELATDAALSLPTVQHAVIQTEKLEACRFDAVMMLQPTCPMRTGADIDEAIAKLIDLRCDSVVSVVNVEGQHPFRMKRIVAGDRLASYIDQGFEDMRPRQALPPVYIRSGSIYLSRREVVMDQDSLVGEDCRALIIPPERAINIDSVEDLLVAEYHLRKRNGDCAT